jgi:hypothetical protein
VKESWRLEALETERADFSGPMMVDYARRPLLFDPRARGRNAASRFARDNQQTYAVLGQRALRSVLGGHLGEPQRVGRRSNYGRANRVDDRQSLLAGHAAARHAVQPQLTPGFKPGPESQERTEREREEYAVSLLDARRAIDGLPALEHPLPALVRIDPTKRPPRR